MSTQQGHGDEQRTVPRHHPEGRSEVAHEGELQDVADHGDRPAEGCQIGAHDGLGRLVDPDDGGTDRRREHRAAATH